MIGVAKTYIPNWIGFFKILGEDLREKEREKIIELCNEIGIYKSNTK